MRITNGEILRYYREARGLSQNQLSKATGIPRGTIAACELRQSRIDKKTAKIYDNYFKVQKDWIERFLDWLP